MIASKYWKIFLDIKEKIKMSRKMIYKIVVLILLIMVALVYSKNKDNGTNALKTTDIAPLFISIDHNDNEIKLSDYLGKYVVIYFFPKAFTPGWTKQACGFRDKYDIYIDNNIVVLGISYDSPKKLRKFREKHRLPFTFISDYDKSISKKYNSGGILFPSRKTIIIDPKGTIIEIVENINIDSHSTDIINIVLNHQKLEDIN